MISTKKFTNYFFHVQMVFYATGHALLAMLGGILIVLLIQNIGFDVPNVIEDVTIACLFMGTMTFRCIEFTAQYNRAKTHEIMLGELQDIIEEVENNE